MSATLRYDIGVGAAEVLSAYEGSTRTAAGIYAPSVFGVASLLEEIGAIHTSRWAGVNRGGNTAHVVTFALKLPGQVKLAYDLMCRAYWLARDLRKLPPGVRPIAVGAVQRRALGTISRKLSLSLGIHDPGEMGIPNIFDSSGEDAFTCAIHDSPDDLVSWMAYADWLSEQPETEKKNRGKVIAGWLARKAMKMKYGVPIIATPQKWSWLQEK